jgi:hypothetical protein
VGTTLGGGLIIEKKETEKKRLCRLMSVKGQTTKMEDPKIQTDDITLLHQRGTKRLSLSKGGNKKNRAARTKKKSFKEVEKFIIINYYSIKEMSFDKRVS